MRYTAVLNTSHVEVLVTYGWNSNLHVLVCPKIKCFVVNFQCQAMDAKAARSMMLFLRGHLRARRIAVHPSEWGMKATQFLSPDVSRLFHRHCVIHNPLMLDAMVGLDDDESAKVAGSFCFTATWERGGDIALRAFDKGDFACFTKMDYMSTSSVVPPRSKVRVCGSADKQTLFSILATTEYFVYPLALPNGWVHKDTFACCVAEALALGVIVLTWDVAALTELYGEVVQMIPFPKHARVADLKAYAFTNDMSLGSEEAVDAILETIRKLDGDPDLKREIREKGRLYARSKFSPDAACAGWAEILK